jgi:hypothetical protein
MQFHSRRYGLFKEFYLSIPVSTARQLLHREPAAHTEESTEDKAKYPSPLTDRDTSMMNSTKRSSVRYRYMENVSSLRSAGGRVCSACRYTSSCSNYTVMMSFLTRRCTTGAGSSRWAGSLSKAQRGLADPSISVFNFEFRGHLRRCHMPLFDALPRPHTLLQHPCSPFGPKSSA